MSYEYAMKMAGATIHRFEMYGSYQGDWLAEVSYNGQRGFVHGSYGSCSGCDAYQAECEGFSHNAVGDEEVSDWHWGSYEDHPECEKCREALQSIAAFGRSYLGNILSKEEMVEELEKGLEWAWDKSETMSKLRWVDPNWTEPKPVEESVVIETEVEEIKTEDSGCAKIIEVSGDEEEGVWARIVSWSEKHNHPFVESLEGKRVRVTIEVIDELD
jgi:hypothetical protein